MTKKLLLLLAFMLILTGCTKTDVDMDLQQARENEEILTPEESEILNQEDPKFREDYLNDLIEANEEQKVNEDYTLVTELEDSEENKLSGNKIKGSCNAIAEASTCIEYYGSIWTEEQMRFNCSDSGTFSLSPCPADMAGGCNTGMGLPSDMVAWMYLRGGGEMTAESLKYAKGACDATIASKWLIR